MDVGALRGVAERQLDGVALTHADHRPWHRPAEGPVGVGGPVGELALHLHRLELDADGRRAAVADRRADVGGVTGDDGCRPGLGGGHGTTAARGCRLRGRGGVGDRCGLGGRRVVATDRHREERRGHAQRDGGGQERYDPPRAQGLLRDPRFVGDDDRLGRCGRGRTWWCVDRHVVSPSASRGAPHGFRVLPMVRVDRGF